jgi:hypothetical protein
MGGALLDIQQVSLAGADVDQQADGQRQIGFAREVFDGLRLAVFEDREIVLGQVADQAAVLVMHRSQYVDQRNVHGDGRRQILGGLICGLSCGGVLGQVGQQERQAKFAIAGSGGWSGP